MSAAPLRLSFTGASGAELSARLDLPAGPVKAYALFAHCFTCGKDIIAARTIATALTASGIAVLRFDFTGLGGSEGEFASTNFAMNIADLRSAAKFLEDTYQAPKLLIGHSLGGAAVLAAAPSLPSVKAVATIAAPAQPRHLKEFLGPHLDQIEAEGEASVKLGQRTLTISKGFVDDLEAHDIAGTVSTLKKALLILHSPTDNTVGIENATDIFIAAKHPKSFVSLDNADHLLSDKKTAAYAADVIAAWSRKYLDVPNAEAAPAEQEEAVVVTETRQGKFQNLVSSGPHGFIADEPTSYGGLGSGPSPYDLLCAALGTCTTMTIRLYADRKKLPLERVTCRVDHEKTHAKDMDQGVGDNDVKPDKFTRRIMLEGPLSEEVKARIMEIADKCPVHKTLHQGATIVTESEAPS